VQRHGGLHVMVPNAGVGRPEPLLAMDLAAWRAVTSVNLDGVFLSIRHGSGDHRLRRRLHRHPRLRHRDHGLAADRALRGGEGGRRRRAS